MSGLAKSFGAMICKSYQGLVGSKAGSVGIKYQDLLIEHDDVAKAISRIEPDILHDRERRIKRAFDLSAKKKLLPDEKREGAQITFDAYLEKNMQLANRDREERNILNGY
mmetsp:Transcript_4691/g.4835  ORF Transcript_4691/g.4835 Transcript_4691/m.4835 type:complete len:110 (-) Transcript_4691:269-598(-)